MLELTVLTVPDCPNEPVLRDRLAQVLPDYPEAIVTASVIDGEAGAARYGMHGSPTLLVNGVDPFAAPGMPVSVSCRLYRDPGGRVGGAPSVAMLREALRHAVEDLVPAGLAGAVGRGPGVAVSRRRERAEGRAAAGAAGLRRGRAAEKVRPAPACSRPR